MFVIKLVIDNWGITDLEKLRLSNIKKFQIAFTKYIFIGITFVATMFIMLVLSDQFNEIEGNLIYGMLAVFFIIFIVATFIAEKIITFVASLLSFRYEYHIVNDQGESVYRIIKLSANNSLLVEWDGIEEFLDSKLNRRYKKIRIKDNTLEEFYASKKSGIFIIGLSILSFGLFLLMVFTIDWWQFSFFLAFIIALVFTLILLLNKNEYKKNNISEANSDI
ncbi:hypothetical protein MKY37_19395 [Psychrobacillus sp. FSL K6-2836]|uniref:hypothetical protein n=1 Tax=Psychrobacillus sp. FSL K6-2836 TaxID=2921548 RepID=UPI0030FB1AB2